MLNWQEVKQAILADRSPCALVQVDVGAVAPAPAAGAGAPQVRANVEHL
ncbi:MAG: hypothetical protein ACJA1F_002282 [Paracoccaceae bacterium]|jgi:hypothetical protein